MTTNGPWGSSGDHDQNKDNDEKVTSFGEASQKRRDSKSRHDIFGNGIGGRRGSGGGFGGGDFPPNMIPGFFKNFRLILLFVAALWLVQGIYRVEPGEQAVIMQFGKWVATADEGLHYHWPYPIQSRRIINVANERRIEIGYASRGGSSLQRGASYQTDRSSDVPEESLMLTGDENIVDVDFAIFWRIKDARQYSFNARNPDDTVKIAAESVMREIVGQTKILDIITGGKELIETSARQKLQALVDEYQIGVEITGVALQGAFAPQQVNDAFDEVQRAKQDKERKRNEAEAYRNDILPRARGESEKIRQAAEAYRAEIVNRAEGDAKRFTQIYEAYRRAPDVTAKRIYLETMEEILQDMPKVILDGKAGQQILPYLPVNELNKKTPKQEG